jgi:hypothetical protein
MSSRRCAWLFLVATSFVGALAVACSSFKSSDDTTAQDGGGGDGDGASETATDAAASPETSEPADASDGAASRFCAQQAATALLCDDFEENDGGLVVSWELSVDGGTIVPAAAPMRAGHAVKISTAGDGPYISLRFGFPVTTAIAGVVFEADVFIDTVGYNYAELAQLEMSASTGTYFGGMAKGGDGLGMHYNPFSGPEVPIGTTWHHLRVELGRATDGGFSQTVTIDKTVVEQTSQDLSTLASAAIELGVLGAVASPGTPIAVLYFDNVLLRPQ